MPFVQAGGDVAVDAEHVCRNVYIFRPAWRNGLVVGVEEYADPITFRQTLDFPSGRTRVTRGRGRAPALPTRGTCRKTPATVWPVPHSASGRTSSLENKARLTSPLKAVAPGSAGPENLRMNQW